MEFLIFRERWDNMGKLQIAYRVLGVIGTNVYFLINTETNQTILVDPADNAEYILDQCEMRDYYVSGILLTHGHFDHIYAINDLKKHRDIPVYACAAEEKLLADPELNRSAAWASPCSVKADVLLTDGQEFDLAGFHIRMIHTPGHTAGSCCYYIEDEKVLFSGDTLFYESFGRTDLETGSQTAIIRSIRGKLLVLPPDVQVYPGHEEFTTIEHERKYNPARG